MKQNTAESLSYLSTNERLSAYNLILRGCVHNFSKGKLQQDKALETLNILVPLTKTDPIFLSQLLSYVMKKTKNKDLQLFLIAVNALSSGDGLPFSVSSKYKKPNFRIVSAAALQMLDPKMVKYLAQLVSLKYSVPNYLNESRHFPNILRTAFVKYLKYREANLQILKGIKKAGLANAIKIVYQLNHLAPSDEAASILRWQQKSKKITFSASPFKDFDTLDDLAIAERIRKDKLPVLGVLGALPRQISPVIAVALLEQCTGNQAVILRKTFEDNGVLKDPDVFKLYEEKIKTAKTALDRVEALTQTASKEVKEMMGKARSDKRKEEIGDIGKIFIHLDASPSMESAFEIAREKGAIIADMVQNPKENFMWAKYDSFPKALPFPEEFIQDAFKAALFGQQITGSGTNCFATYPQARQFGADIDIHISDGNHNYGNLASHINSFHTQNPQFPKPKVMVWIKIENEYTDDTLKNGYEQSGIPVASIKPETLNNSALVTEAVRSALIGPTAIIDEIMSTEILRLPDWYATV